ncbi:MAG TPA: hypothetical protein VK008_07480 [Sphingobacteriaceae bacterium]|nr:hypothetical protein [Sphingobacteriaceae bacterium]
MGNARKKFRLVTMLLGAALFVVIVRVYLRQMAGSAGAVLAETLWSSLQLVLLVGVPAVLLFIAVAVAGDGLAGRKPTEDGSPGGGQPSRTPPAPRP